MSVAAVIPCHNGAAFLAEALESVRSQSRPVDEVIVVDDRSDDGSAALARTLGATVVPSPSPGPAAARNAGWQRAQADRLAFLDADDRWLPDHCAVLGDLLDRFPEAAVAFGGVELIGMASGRFNQVLLPGVPVDARAVSATRCVVPQMAVMVRRSVLSAAGGYDESLAVGEDFELFARLSHLGNFVSAPQVTAQYRQYPEQTTRRRRQAVALASVAIRYRNWRALEGRLPPAELEEVARTLRTRWDEELEFSWREGDREGFEALLQAGSQVPEGEAIASRWRRRATFGWHGWQMAATIWRILRLRRLANALGVLRAEQTGR